MTGGVFEADNLAAIVEWEGNSGCLNFIVSLTWSNGTTSDYNNISTIDTSYTFNILYNTNYTVTVRRNNSTEISKAFNFSKHSIMFMHNTYITINFFLIQLNVRDH